MNEQVMGGDVRAAKVGELVIGENAVRCSFERNAAGQLEVAYLAAMAPAQGTPVTLDGQAMTVDRAKRSAMNQSIIIATVKPAA